MKLKNTSENTIALFVRINGIDEQVELKPKQSIIVDEYETKTIKIFSRKGLIKIESKKSTEYVVDGAVDGTIEGDTPNKTSEPTLEQAKKEVNEYVDGEYVKGFWSDEEIMFLKKNYPTKGRKFCSKELNRQEHSVQKKIINLKLKKRKKRKKSKKTRRKK